MSHYFDESPGAGSAAAEVAVKLRDTMFTLRTDRGVFSRGRLDAGTALLLRDAPVPPADGVGLDLGCGAGPIALTLARRAPAVTVWAVDVNERARHLCAENAAANGVGNVVVAAPDDVPDDVRFDVMWSNPPIRIGKPALHDLLGRWLDRLTPSGRAVLVVHKHLGLRLLAAVAHRAGPADDPPDLRQGLPPPRHPPPPPPWVTLFANSCTRTTESVVLGQELAQGDIDRREVRRVGGRRPRGPGRPWGGGRR